MSFARFKPWLPWLTLFLLRFWLLDIHAATETSVTKYNLPYEITGVSIDQGSLVISGWAFISYQQHFIDSSDHQVEIEFISAGHGFREVAQLTMSSQTSMMEYFGSPQCSSTSLYQAPEICNYRYDNVGFTLKVPMERFNLDTNYQTNILVHAFTADRIYKTPLYFPMDNDLVLSQGNREITLISRLYDTELKVNATTVLARKEPSKTGLTWFSGINCSTSYLNQLYFLKDSVYKNVYEKRLVGDTSFYRVSANLYLCSLYRRRIVEGSSLSPVWIASPYVLYSGSPLQISVKSINQAPSLNITNVEITEGDGFDYRDHVRAIDPEEGDISARISLLSSNFSSKPGFYALEFIVYDLQGLSAQGTLFVNVLTKPNMKPIIHALDKQILQYSKFDPYKEVTAYDVEDGDLTNRITTPDTIDTSITGNNQVCYNVLDSVGQQDTTCINVEVIDYATFVNRFRFLSSHQPFYSEAIPDNWYTSINRLNEIIESTQILQTIRIS